MKWTMCANPVCSSSTDTPMQISLPSILFSGVEAGGPEADPPAVKGGDEPFPTRHPLIFCPISYIENRLTF